MSVRRVRNDQRDGPQKGEYAKPVIMWSWGNSLYRTGAIGQKDKKSLGFAMRGINQLRLTVGKSVASLPPETLPGSALATKSRSRLKNDIFSQKWY